MNEHRDPTAETVLDAFRFIVVTPPGLGDPALAIAASRAGSLGVLDLQFLDDLAKARTAVHTLARQSRGRCGIKIDSCRSPLNDCVLSDLPNGLSVAILSPIDPRHVLDRVRMLRELKLKVLLEVISEDEALAWEGSAIDGLIAKGHESGGRIGEETTFVLLQRLLRMTALPVWAQGGIGLHSAAACMAAGAAGVILDSQLALTRESTLTEDVKAAISHLDGGETVCIGSEVGACVRVFAPSGGTALADLQRFVEVRQPSLGDDETRREVWRQVSACIGWDTASRHLWPIGQEASLAAPLANRFGRVAPLLDAFRDATASHFRAAKALRPLAEGSPLALAHNTRYPIVQGPMTRVSDRAEFAKQVAEGGALPFLALALMRAPEVERLLDQTRAALGTRPWGVGILGFVPESLRIEQLEVVRAAKPAVALIAGGRPDQAASLEREGIPTYLHVPSPDLLKLFIAMGTRRFVLEGRECGGHVGPRGSFALWDSAVETLLANVPASQIPACHVLFAGGIHDARSASMVATLAAPLAEHGAKIGVLLGTAYLFTREAVATGAIVEGFQQEAVACRQTVLLNSGPGHATRCASSPYVDLFERERRRLLDEGRSVSDVRGTLEALNLGRLRIATKGVRRSGNSGDGPTPSLVNDPEQHSEGMYMMGQVAALRNSTCSIDELHHDISHGGSERLDHAGTVRLTRAVERQKPRPFDVAIIGMSCLLPKAPDIRAYWDNILQKVDAVTEVPRERWDWRKYYDPDPAAAADKVNSKWGGFLDPIHFDPARYGMPPTSLASIEPLHLLTLEAVREALADAGYLDRELYRHRTAVILGVGGGIADLGQQYAVRSALPMLFDAVPSQSLSKLATWSEDSFPGILPNVAAGRVANRFDLRGVNFTVDAACASSLAAVYLACRELEDGTSDMVVVGGADTIQNPFAYLCFGKTHALSPRGRCATFDESADGIAISEGVGILILKRLLDAEQDGDRIYAVIKGVAGSSDGREKGLTAPRPEGQALALERAYEKAGVSPASVGLVEAHGTGTVAGDLAELETLNGVFEAAGAVAESCAIGSVKSMIGHTKSTAGVAGVIKGVLALHNKVLPPTIHISNPNPAARRSGSPLYINTEARPWVHANAGEPRRAGVSAFGFGGTNFHAVIEEYTGQYLEGHQEMLSRDWPSELFVWSGESRTEIQTTLRRLRDALARGSRPRLCDLAYSTWQAARNRSALTLALVVSSLDDLRDKVEWSISALGDFISPAALSSKRVSFTDTPLARGGRTAFLFPGQGSQYPGMLSELAIYFGDVRVTFERASRVLSNRLPRPLASYVFPPPRFRPEDRRADSDALMATAVAQPALGAAAIALHRLLGECSVLPDMVAGHSYGEYVALWAAGSVDEETLYALSEARGRCITEGSAGEPGAMAAVATDQRRTAAVVDGMDGVWIANSNAPSQTVISGKRDAVDAAIEQFDRAGIGSRRLPVGCAFHSPLMTAAREQLAQIIQKTTLRAPRLPLFSNVSAAPYPDDAAQASSQLIDQLVRPVRFAEQVQAMYDAGARVFIEVGPANVLSGLVNQILGAAPHVTVPLNVTDRSALFQFQYALGELAAHGATVNLDPLFARRAVRLIDIDSLAAIDREAPSATAWTVTGGRATPLRSTSPASSMQPANEPSVTLSEPVSVPSPLVEEHAAPAIFGRAPITGPVLDATDNGARALVQFQQLMASFLETQKQVMLAYLAGDTAGKAPAIDTARPADDSGRGATAAVSLRPSSAAAPETQPQQKERANADTDLTSQLLSIVCERTGYPTELLGLDLNVEADLGIDSIKRVEIVGEFGRRVLKNYGVELHDVMSRLSSAKTLRAVADTARILITGAPVSSTVHENERLDNGYHATAGERDEVPRFILEIQDAPLPAHGTSIGTADLVVITDDGRGVAEQVAALLRSRGAQVALLGPANDLTDSAGVTEYLDEIKARYLRPVSGILHLQPLKHLAYHAAMETQHAAENEVRTLFHLTRNAAADLKDAGTRGRGWVIAATAMGGAFGKQSAGAEWIFGHGAIAGFMKTLALEWPEVRCKIVDFEADNPSSLAERLMGEIQCAPDFSEVGFRGSRRVTVLPIRDRLDQGERVEFAIDPQSVLLVTGGARGITAAILIDVARRYRPTLVIVGRTAGSGAEPPHVAGVRTERELKKLLVAEAHRSGQPTSVGTIEETYTSLVHQREVRDNLDEMRRLGAHVDYRQVDVVDEGAFRVVIDEVYRTYGRIDCVIHGAGVTEDHLLEHKNADSFARVFDTKVRSALTLTRCLRPESLKFFAMFSSVAGCFGNQGQIDYAAANDTLNKLALYLDFRWPGRVVSLNWGPWDSVGMASGGVRQLLIERGMKPIEIAAGCLAFDRELRCGRKGQAEVVLGEGRWGRIPPLLQRAVGSDR